MRAKKESLKGAWGWYQDGKIVLSDKLQKTPIPSQQEILEHEKMHQYIDENKIKLSARDEEFACWVWSIYISDIQSLTHGEVILQNIIKRRIGRLTKIGIIRKIKQIKEELT